MTGKNAFERQVRVLLLDDEESLRVPLKNHLEKRFGYHVDAVADGKQALQQVEKVQGQYDVALIDEVLIQPPNGIEVMKQIRAHYPDIECILFTGWGASSKQRALQAGAFHYLEKPFDIDELAMLIRSAAQQVRLRKISRAILSERDLEKVLERIDRAATSLSLADEAAIVLLNPDTGKIEVRTRSYSGQVEWTRHFRDPALSREIIDHGKLVKISDTTQDDRVEPKVVESGIRSFVGLPIPGEQGNLGVLYVYSRQPRRFDEAGTLAVLQTLASLASLAITNARAFQQIESHGKYMETLVRVAQGFTRATKIDELLRLAWDFVRTQWKLATFFVALYDQKRDVLRFPLAYDEGKPVEIPEQRLGDDKARWSIAGYVAKTGRELHWFTEREALQTSQELGIKPQQIGKPCRSALFLPLRTESEVLGVISVQSYRRHAFSPTLLDALRALGSQLTVAIQNVRLFEETQRGLAQLQAAYRASQEVIRAQEPNKALKAVVEEALKATQAQWVKLVLVDEELEPYEVIPFGKAPKGDLRQRIRPDGISKKVIGSEKPEFIEDVAASNRVNPAMLEEKVGAAACLPFAPRGHPIGVLWVHYDKPRSFSEAERQALQLYASQAATAYDNARRMQELEQMRRAAEALSRTSDLRQALQQIVESAVQVMGANSAAIWSYDEARGIFIPEELVAAGIPESELEKFREEEPKPGRTADTVMRKGYISVTDLSRPAYNFLGQTTRGLLDRVGVRSFQGIALRVGEERLGVLYVNYNRSRSFDEEDERKLRTFANHAALALKNARLLSRLQRTREAAEVITRVTLEEDLHQTLTIIAKYTQQVLRSDAVTIYSYDEVTGRLGAWAAEIHESREPDSARPPKELKPTSGVWGILGLDAPPFYHLAEDQVGEDDLLGGRFVRDEEIRAAIGIQLRVGGQKVGVMFVNFRSPHRFTEDEIATIQLFGGQAAVAIRNAQQYAEIMRQANLRRGLLQAAQQITGVRKPKTILQNIVNIMRDVVACDVVTLYTYDQEHNVVGYPAYVAGELRYPQKLNELGYVDEESVVGKLLKSGQAHFAEDALTDPLMSAGNFVKREDIKSSAGLPLMFGDRVLGIIFVNYRDLHSFPEWERESLQLFATLAATALHNAYLFDQVEKANNGLQALYEAGQIISSTLALEDILERIAEQAWRLSGRHGKTPRFSHIALKEGRWLRIKAAYPPEYLAGPIRKMGDVDLKGAGPFGVSGRAVKEGKPQIVGDTTQDPDYIPHGSKTRSELAVPINLGEEVIGVINVEHPAPHAFDEDDLRDLTSLAAQAAIAIQNARLYERSQIVARISWEATQSLELDTFLNTLFASLKEIFARRQIPVCLSLMTYNKDKNILIPHPTSFYPEKKKVNAVPLNARGIMTLVARTREPYYAPDVSRDPHYLRLLPDTRSEIAVPILFGGELLGVLDLESPVLDAFTPQDQQLLKTLADQVAVMLQNVRQYEALKRAKSIIGARTALAWMGMTSSAWRHEIDKHAVTICDLCQLVHQEIQKPSPRLYYIQEKVQTIERLAKQIQEKPIVPPLSSEEGTKPVNLSDLVSERAKQLWQREPYKKVELYLDLQMPDGVTVQVSPEWLRRAFDELVDNAVEAVRDRQVQKVTIGTRLARGGAEIWISDTGPGIPEDIRAKIGLETIEKPEDARGLGMGLLIAQTIVQTYGGEIRVENTGPEGTTMVIWLPVVAEELMGDTE